MLAIDWCEIGDDLRSRYCISGDDDVLHESICQRHSRHERARVAFLSSLKLLADFADCRYIWDGRRRHRYEVSSSRNGIRVRAQREVFFSVPRSVGVEKRGRIARMKMTFYIIAELFNEAKLIIIDCIADVRAKTLMYKLPSHVEQSYTRNFSILFGYRLSLIHISEPTRPY